jgi:PHP domain
MLRLKMETHLHTVHSDGHDSVAAMFEACQAAGYEVVALTDHNTVSGLPEGADAARRLGLVFVPGVEVTTFRGHAVVLGVTRVPEWRDLEVRGFDALVHDVHEQGGLVCVAHPAAQGSPMCSGCTWEWPFEPTGVDLWEVFSAARPYTEVAVDLWRGLLARGGRAAPVAAGDVHSVAAAARRRPATYVYARERSTNGVLEALRAGRVSADLDAERHAG